MEDRDILRPQNHPNIAGEPIMKRKEELARLAMIPATALMLSANTLSAIAAPFPFGPPGFPGANQAPTATPIKHVIVLFQENVSFDHYFGTYPDALNARGEQPFNAYPGTPSVNGLPPALLTQNQNVSTSGVQVNPQRLSPAQAYTCSQSHNYTPEQTAVDSGLLDNFPAGTGRTTSEGCAADGSTVLDYYDGNTVGAMWRYAQNYALNDNSFGSNFGPSSVGAINLVSGETGGAVTHFGVGSSASFPGTVGAGQTVIGDFDAYLDDCGADAGGTSTGTTTLEMTGKNVGDLLNAKGVTWGWFQGGFRATTPSVNGSVAQCHDGRVPHEYPSVNPTVVVPNPVAPLLTGADVHTAATSPTNFDYVSHHDPFQFYASTRNSHHLPPSSVAAIGHQDQANHQYDTRDFFAALNSGHLPAVSFVKAPSAYNGHPGNSDPTVEQYWLTQVINDIQLSPDWASTAIIIAYDDSDGWYDHLTGPIVSPSHTSADVYSSHGCGDAAAAALAIPGRCGYGPRLPLLVVSPWANPNYVDHTLTNQASILKFIEDNWKLGRIDATELPPGAGSFDQTSGSLLGLFSFDAPPSKQPVLLTCSGNYARNPHEACELDPSQTR